MKSDKLNSLTTFRFIAASAVVLFHYGRDTIAYWLMPAFFAAGSTVVTFFFVLSGFVIAIAHDRKQVDLRGFYLSRLSRIYPVYLLALILCVVIATGGSGGYEFSVSALAIQAWLPKYATTLNFPGWSISVEALFYALAPALILFFNHASKLAIKWFICGSGLFWLASQFVLAKMNGLPVAHEDFSVINALVNYFPVSHLCSFVVGFSGGIAYKRNMFCRYLSPRENFMMMLLALSICWLLSKNGKWLNELFGLDFAYGSSFYAVVFLPVIYFCAKAESYISPVTSIRFFVLLGESSYSLYILQVPVRSACERFFPGFAHLGVETQFLTYFLSLVLVSILVYLLLERPVSKFSRSWLRARRSNVVLA